MNKLKANLMLLSAAIIWGCAFVAQSVAMDSIGPWTFTCVRSIIAGITLLPVIRFLDSRKSDGEKRPTDRKTLIIGGISCGLALTVASMFQQTGIMYTTVSKAGFITALYVIFVPFLSVFLRKRVKLKIWFCAVLSAIGLYFLSMQNGFGLSRGDTLVFLCAIAYAVHILVIDHFSPKTDGARMSCIQFFTVAVICFIPMIVIEHPSVSSLISAAVPILYAGVMSSAAGYTLQILGQKDADPTIASMLLSLESVFATLAGFVLLHQTLSVRELMGCLLMFTAIIIAQLPDRKKVGS